MLQNIEITRRGALTILRELSAAHLGDQHFQNMLVKAAWNGLKNHYNNPITLHTGAKMMRIDNQPVGSGLFDQRIIVYGYAWDGHDLAPYRQYEVKDA